MVNGKIVDRSWDGWPHDLAYDAGHPIRLEQSVLDRFKSRFTTIYELANPVVSVWEVELKFIDNYFVGRK